MRAHRDAARTAPASDAERGGIGSPHSAEPIPSSGPRPVFPLKRALAKKCPGEFAVVAELLGAFSGLYRRHTARRMSLRALEPERSDAMP